MSTENQNDFTADSFWFDTENDSEKDILYHELMSVFDSSDEWVLGRLPDEVNSSNCYVWIDNGIVKFNHKKHIPMANLKSYEFWDRHLWLEHANQIYQRKLMPKKRAVVRPAFYAQYLPALQKVAREKGYNLLVHGSMNRDLDIVCVPWVDSPKSELALIQALDMCLNDKFEDGLDPYHFGVLPGGRHSYVIDIYRNQPFTGQEDQQLYLDVSVTPSPHLFRTNEQ